MAVHERPKALLFVPYTTKARVCGSIYLNALDHDDTEYVVATLAGATQATGFAGSGTTNFNITGLALNARETYTLRIRYVNGSGDSDWSDNYAATVFSSGFDLTALPGPALPGETSAPLTLDLAPSYQVDIETLRGIVTHVSIAGHHIRRLTSIEGTRRVRLSWFALTLAQRDTVLKVLQDSLGSYDTSEVRGFDFSTVASTPRPLDGLTYFPTEGTIVSREITTGVYEVAIDATEIKP